MKEGEDPMLQDEAANENVGGEVDMTGDRRNTQDDVAVDECVRHLRATWSSLRSTKCRPASSKSKPAAPSTPAISAANGAVNPVDQLLQLRGRDWRHLFTQVLSHQHIASLPCSCSRSWRS